MTAPQVSPAQQSAVVAHAPPDGWHVKVVVVVLDVVVVDVEVVRLVVDVLLVDDDVVVDVDDDVLVLLVLLVLVEDDELVLDVLLVLVVVLVVGIVMGLAGHKPSLDGARRRNPRASFRPIRLSGPKSTW